MSSKPSAVSTTSACLLACKSRRKIPPAPIPKRSWSWMLQEGGRYTIGYGFGFEVLRSVLAAQQRRHLIRPLAIRTPPRLPPAPAAFSNFPRQYVRACPDPDASKLGPARCNIARWCPTRRTTSCATVLSAALTDLRDNTQDVSDLHLHPLRGSAPDLREAFSRPVRSISLFFSPRGGHQASTIPFPTIIPFYSQPTLVSGFGITYASRSPDNPSDPRMRDLQHRRLSFASMRSAPAASFLRAFLPEFLLPSLRPRLRLRPLHALRHRTAAGTYRQTADELQPDHYTGLRLFAARTLLFRRRAIAARDSASTKPARAIRARASHRRPRAAYLQSGIAFPDATAFHRQPPGRHCFTTVAMSTAT